MMSMAEKVLQHVRKNKNMITNNYDKIYKEMLELEHFYVPILAFPVFCSVLSYSS